MPGDREEDLGDIQKVVRSIHKEGSSWPGVGEMGRGKYWVTQLGRTLGSRERQRLDCAGSFLSTLPEPDQGPHSDV